MKGMKMNKRFWMTTGEIVKRFEEISTGEWAVPTVIVNAYEEEFPTMYTPEDVQVSLQYFEYDTAAVVEFNPHLFLRHYREHVQDQDEWVQVESEMMSGGKLVSFIWFDKAEKGEVFA